jgi:hypothetical protein
LALLPLARARAVEPSRRRSVLCGMAEGSEKIRPKSRRAYSQVRRRYRVAVWFSEDEITRVRRAAERSGKAVAALIGQAAIDVVDMRALPASRGLLMALQKLEESAAQVQAVGRNLNQVVAKLHSTGVTARKLDHAVDRVNEVLDRLDDAAGEVRKAL